MHISVPSFGLKPNWLPIVSRYSDNLSSKIHSTTFKTTLSLHIYYIYTMYINYKLQKVLHAMIILCHYQCYLQVENEYGSYSACDRLYTRHLRDEFIKYLGKDVLLFTTDGNGVNLLNCGTVDGVYATVDFGSGKRNAFFLNPNHALGININLGVSI